MQTIKSILRLEGLALAAAAAWCYAHLGFSWPLFAVLWLAPDLSMLGYVAGKRNGAVTYNTFHTTLGPALLAAAALITSSHKVLAIALIWANHIGVDRLLGFGLKTAEGFRSTHLNEFRQRG